VLSSPASGISSCVPTCKVFFFFLSLSFFAIIETLISFKLDIFYGKKERRKNSINRKFWGDYLKIAHNPYIVDIMKKGGDSNLRFSDNVWKTNKNYKRQQRSLLITEKVCARIDNFSLT